ncbi:Ribosomal protein S27e [Gossypium australe]|uniref:Ribosomal protein S27e n=1 Tax=Gossypium australe TaxID=47621 RepID=A0A5B6WY60_9ROSI|nr:Ribosomal protein S27e [Gossypium australe]
MPRLFQHCIIFMYLCANMYGAHVLERETTVFSHSQTVVVCGNCQTVLCQPTGGRARLTEGCSFRKKGD